MHPYVERTLTVLWYIALPFWKILQVLYFLLKPLRYTLHLLSLPFIYLGHFIVKAVRWPFEFLAKFEDLYIYLSVAILIGAITGLAIYTIYITLLPILDLAPSARSITTNGSAQPKPSGSSPPSNASNGAPKKQSLSEAGRTVADFRAERRRKKGQFALTELDAELSPTSLAMGDAKGKWHRRGMLESPTILEEDDSDF